MSSALSDVLGQLAGTAEGYLSGGVTVAVKTNYTPKLTVYSGSSGGGAGGASSTSGGLGQALSNLVGVQVGVQVRDAHTGHLIASYGPNGGAPATDWVRVAVLLAVVGALGLGLIQLVRAF